MASSNLYVDVPNEMLDMAEVSSVEANMEANVVPRHSKPSCRMLSFKCGLILLSFFLLFMNQIMDFLKDLIENETFWNNWRRSMHASNQSRLLYRSSLL